MAAPAAAAAVNGEPAPGLGRGLRNNLLLSLLLVLLLVSAWNTGSDPLRLARGLPNLWVLAGEMLPPDPALLGTALAAMAETLQIALLGTFLGLLLSLPLALLASRNLYPRWVVVPVRGLLALVRTVPSLLWAVFFVIVVGLGPFPGVLATALYSLGYLGKLHYEAIEAMEPSAHEALAAMGATRLQVIRYVVLPQVAPHLVSQALFMFEYNVRASAILGFVGAGGIGFYIMGYLGQLQYNRVLTFLLVVLAAVLLIDWASLRIRDRFTLASTGSRQRR
ncbi:MAG: phosphonate ABC transporter, permease protein PhnE [Euryarchaeota archaeon]|nr:phosphonate ABC transporter, permease protein PhnE [Euryarchaeota archaeon]